MALQEKLDVWKKDLIDMSRRNGLLYYKIDGVRPSGLHIPNQDVEWLYGHVVKQRRSVSEADLNLPPREEDLGPLKRLERMRVQMRDDEKERGVRSVYMVFGLLEWYEADQSTTPTYSPLLLVPVIINRQVGNQTEYEISWDEDEEIEVNPTLREWMQFSFHVAIPTYPEIAEMAHVSEVMETGSALSEQVTRKKPRLATPSLDAIFAAIESAIDAAPTSAGNHWAVRREAYLGRFSFQKLVMRQDLERHEAEALNHPMLRRLAGEHNTLHEPANITRIEELDTAVHPRDTLEILDADSSQQEAIQAAKAGQSFVLQGPPGTGKSQTIANIIAECLGQEKSVLFVSEKMAALDVVRKRLDAAGLGEFLLDLHDTKRNRRDFVNELKEAVTPNSSPSEKRIYSTAEWQRMSDNLEQRRNRLNTYVHELHLKRFALGISAFEAYGHLALLANTRASDFGLSGNVRAITADRLEQMRESLHQLLDYEDVLDSYSSHPWRGTSLTSFTNEQSTALEDHFNRLLKALSEAAKNLSELATALGESDAQVTFGWAEYACDRTQVALGSPLPPAHWFNAETVARLKAMLPQARTAAESYQRTHDALDAQYDTRIYLLDHQPLLDSLTSDADGAMAMLLPTAGETQHDMALRQREIIDQRLATSADLIHVLVASSKKVADLLEFSEPVTFDEIETMVEMGEMIAATPIPPRSWLDPDVYAEARIVALEAAEKASWAQQARAALSTSYQPSFLEADLSSINGRFHNQYDSFLRYLRPQYYLDIRALRSYLNPDVTRTADELKSDVAMAVKLRETENWLRERGIDHARLLGRHYTGERTDWEHVREMVKWADSFHVLFTEETTTDAVNKLVTGPANVRTSLLSMLEPFTAQWRAWEYEREWLISNVKTQQILAAQGFPDTAANTIEQLQNNLRQYWQAADQVCATRNDHEIPPWGKMVETVRQAQAAHGFDLWLAAQQERLHTDLGVDFVGLATDWKHACDMLEWVESFVALYPDGVPAPLVEWVARSADVEQQRQTIARARSAVLQQLAEVETELRYIESVALARVHLSPNATSQSETTISAMRQRADFLRERIPVLARWVACGRRITDARELGLGALIDDCLKSPAFPRDVVKIFERRFYSIWLDAARADSKVLDEFSGVTQERIINQYRALDVEHMQLARHRLVTLLHVRRLAAKERAAAPNSSRDSTFRQAYNQLVRESQKKRSPAIRQIVLKTGEALLTVKPCWMMSPLAVSQYMDTAAPIFDLVIFDEASQVLTEDAICAILRGKQLIVVGDEKQLPPTSFFAKSLADNDDDEGEVTQVDTAEQERTESILNEMLSANITPRSLKWHYRSQHESLIAFSNTEFYGGQLITFPGPAAEHRDGVRFEYVSDGVYDYGASRTNRREAERVVDLIIRLAQTDPNVSLGVVALSGAQQTAIREALANRFQRNPELEAIREILDEERTDENAFFIKNLESVQGDERDIMALSIGYGRDRHGVMHHRFGPLNNKGGERRLNVAVTRARQQMYVVSSIHATDINPTGSVGVRTLRRYLDYAERGPGALRQQATDVAESADTTLFDSPFEQAVYEALTAKGLRIDTQVGCSGYRIDLAVRDPHQPDRYLLGIECDGRSYHSSKTARDRDRLRQAHLEGLGWNIHRIWSSDWFTNPELEIGKTLESLARARAMTPIRITTERVS